MRCHLIKCKSQSPMSHNKPRFNCESLCVLDSSQRTGRLRDGVDFAKIRRRGRCQNLNLGFTAEPEIEAGDSHELSKVGGAQEASVQRCAGPRLGAAGLRSAGLISGTLIWPRSESPKHRFLAVLPLPPRF